MRTISSLGELRASDQRAVPDGSGKWTVFERGDAVPAIVETGGPSGKQLTAEEFRNAFTQAEIDNLLASTDAGVKRLLYRISTNRSGIDCGSAEVLGGLAYLVTAGLLTNARRIAILT